MTPTEELVRLQRQQLALKKQEIADRDQRAQNIALIVLAFVFPLALPPVAIYMYVCWYKRVPKALAKTLAVLVTLSIFGGIILWASLAGAGNSGGTVSQQPSAQVTTQMTTGGSGNGGCHLAGDGSSGPLCP